MKLAILKVILWAKDQNKPPRVIEFQPGKINVISGESATGKSTLAAIIDYSLGSDKCAIPVGLIREVTGWFGLHLKLANTEMVVARRNPGDQQSTSDIYWDEGLDLVVPSVVARNARVEDLKNRFNQIGHLPTLSLSAEDNPGFAGRPSFRDMAAFNFQPQHIVANPYTLFYKADTNEHREKLKNLFPFVLGALDAEALLKQRELKDLEREHDKLRRELEARRNAVRAWEAEIESYYLQALSLGLLPNESGSRAAWSMSRYVEALQQVPRLVRERDIPDVPEGTSDASVGELTQLLGEEDRLGQQINSTRRRLDKLDQLSASVGSYGDVLAGQTDRMAGVGWFEQTIGSSHECPVCHAKHESPSHELTELKALASSLQSIVRSVSEAPAALDEELSTAREDLRTMETAISKARQKRGALEQQSEKLSVQRQHTRQIYLFVGRVEQALDNLQAGRVDNEAATKERAMAARIASLRSDLDPQGQRRRLDAAVERISATIARYASDLQLEHASESVSLNTKELTLQFKPLSGRTDYLWEVGSGQNWVGYHIAALIALHLHFLELNNSAVPQFMVIDQPSQVYFPEAWPSLDQTPDDQKESVLPDTDIAGVRRIFGALSKFLQQANNQFQVIVTEHAGAITWSGIERVHLVGNWREGHDEFLIPQAWIPPRKDASLP